MEQTFNAGAKLDLLNKDELRDVMRTVTQDWFNQVARGDRYRRFSAEGTIAAGALQIGGAEALDATLGPAEGFVWAVQRVAVHGLTTNSGDPLTSSTEPLQLFVNDEGPSSLVHPSLQGYQAFGEHELVLYPGDTLLAVGTALTKTGKIVLTGQARELPMPLAWRIGG
jgi:hypothetical protein